MRYRLILFFFFLQLIACACPRQREVAATQAKAAAIPDVATSTTIIFPRFSVRTSTDTVETYVRMVESKTMLASAEDQASIEEVIEIVRRANLAELRTVMDDDKEPPIAHPLLRIFWHSVIYRARGFLEFPVCEDRMFFVRRIMEKADGATVSIIIATTWYLRTRHRGSTYACRSKFSDQLRVTPIVVHH